MVPTVCRSLIGDEVSNTVWLSSLVSRRKPVTLRTSIHRLQVATELHEFMEKQVLPGTGLDSAHFWSGFDAIVADLRQRLAQRGAAAAAVGKLAGSEIIAP